MPPLRALLAAFFAFAGSLHFARPKPYETTVPTLLQPWKKEVVALSGVAELAGAALVAGPAAADALGLARDELSNSIRHSIGAVNVLTASATAVEQDVSKTEYVRVNFRERFGANLRRVREAAGLSQEDLMKISDVHRTQISKYERAVSDPQLEAIAKLSRALGVSADEFLDGVDWQADPPRLVIRPREPEERPGRGAAA